MSRNISRRAWLRRVLPEAGEQVARDFNRAAGRALPARRRPPGATAEDEFLDVCTRCADCVEACPYGAIHVLTDVVRIGAGTPVMVPEARPCHMCAGFPCAAACEPGALRVPEQPIATIGTVVVHAERCLPYHGPECGACAGACPPGASALRLAVGRPDVDAGVCVGCGLCIAACPTDPPALALVPLE